MTEVFTGNTKPDTKDLEGRSDPSQLSRLNNVRAMTFVARAGHDVRVGAAFDAPDVEVRMSNSPPGLR